MRIYLYETKTGLAPVENLLGSIQKSESRAWNEIRTGLTLLTQYGVQPGLTRFKRLRYVEGAELYELRVNSSPGYRLFFAPVPDEDAYVILDIVRKDQFTRNPHRLTESALERYDHWIRDVLPLILKGVNDDEDEA